MNAEDKANAELKAEIEELKRILLERHIHFAGILEITNEAIISVDETQRITLFNRGAEKIFGYPEDEVIGQPLDLLIPERFIESHRKDVAEFGNSNVRTRLMADRQEISGLRKNGEEFPAEASISHLEFASGKIFTVILHDISTRRQAELERERLIEDLNTFSHTVAHELKAPLSTIIGFADYLQEEARLTDELQNYLATIIKNGLKMNNMIDELQLLAGIRGAQVEMQPLHMGRIVAEARHRLAYLIKEYQAKIITPDHWPVALGYAPWVEEIWTNYLSNGITHGGQPPSLHLGATTGSDGTIRFWVKDNGLGLTPEAQALLFKPFTKVGQIHTAGKGLGLSIVRRIAEKMGGKVGVESDGVPGRGSVFTFTLKQVASS